MWEKISKIKSWQAILIIIGVGLATYFNGLTNPFMGDDTAQIVDNVVVHSISNVLLFFQGGTFYTGQGEAPLSGVYYRPLMTTTFSAIYSVFGENPLFFHLVQLALVISSTIFLYLFFRHFFASVFCLLLALIFLVHPLDSQVVYGIPAMQDALMTFFGILSLWLVTRLNSRRALLLVALCLVLALFSKEMGVFYVFAVLGYLFFFDKKRFSVFIAIITIPLLLYFFVRLYAVGLSPQAHIAPIGDYSLTERLMTAPSIVFFYITKLIFPFGLASAYYWVHPSFSVSTVLVPLLIALIIVGFLVWIARKIRTRDQDYFKVYIFFFGWALSGLIPYLQIVPLDMTACDNWFRFSMVGVLGMAGATLMTFAPRIQLKWFYIVAVLLVLALSVSTAVRGLDWNSPYSLARAGIAASKDNFYDHNIVAQHYISTGEHMRAEQYAKKSIELYPNASNYNTLGASLMGIGNLEGAKDAFTKGLPYLNSQFNYDNLAKLSIYSDDYSFYRKHIHDGLAQYEQDPVLLLYLALLEARDGNEDVAKIAVTQAARYMDIPAFIYRGIMDESSFVIDLGNNKTIQIY